VLNISSLLAVVGVEIMVVVAVAPAALELELLSQ
jgi:hypothetical protein